MADVRNGRPQMVFELDNCSEAAAKEAFRVVAGFLPMKTGWVEWR